MSVFFSFIDEQYIIENKIPLAEVVRVGREQLGMNRSQFANESGVSRSELARIEDGIHRKPSMRNLEKLARILNIRLETLMQIAEHLPNDAETFSLAAHYPGLKSEQQVQAAETIIRLIGAYPELTEEDYKSTERYLKMLVLARRVPYFYDK